MPFSSPPASDLNAAPNCEPMFRDRTVNPKTSPNTEVTLYPGTSFMVEMSMAVLSVRLIVGVVPVASGVWRGV
jgi:hypothetical protein